jgi:hypothetical protein
MIKKKRGQVWIETVIYTLIAFILIAAVLAFVRPKIQEMQDQAIIKQSIALIKDIDNLISSVSNGPAGNKRLIELNINQGILKIDGLNDMLIFEILTAATYSEPGVNITDGNILVRTDKLGDENKVTLERKYDSLKYNITNSGKDEIKSLSKGTTAYKLFISNLGGETKTNIDMEIK